MNRRATRPAPHRWVVHNIASPYSLAVLSFGVFLIAWLMPPSIYVHAMREPDLMFLDPATLLFYSLCVVSFIAGVWLIGWIFPTQLASRRMQTRVSPLLFVLIPLVMGITISIAMNIYLVAHFPNTILLLFSKQGGDIKDALNYDDGGVNGRLSVLGSALSGLIWWAYWRSSELTLTTRQRRLVLSCLSVLILSAVVFSTLMISRNALLLLLSGLAIVYIVRRTIAGRVSFKFLFKAVGTFAFAIILLFVTFSFLRGTSSWEDQLTSLLGYTVASYNRLTALLDGRLRYPFAGSGFYLSNIVIHSRLLPLRAILLPPDYVEMWASEFGAVSQAGLDGGLIWSGTFGYIFSDLGWFSVLFIAGYGLLYGAVWNSIKRGSVFGVVLYPCFAFCVLFWFGSNYLLDVPLEGLFIATICLIVYEFVWVKRSVISALLTIPDRGFDAG